MTKQSPTIEQALEAFLAGHACVAKAEEVPLLQALNRVLAEDIRAPFSVPSFPKSAMDGYAVRASEVAEATAAHPVVLRVIGERLAGESLSLIGNVEGQEADSVKCMDHGTALRIMTGAEIPSAYDAVVREEDTDYGETQVQIFCGVKQFQNYCAVGEDIREGDIVIPAGTRLGRIEIGTLASLGFATVPVRRKLNIQILSTGTELVDIKVSSPLPSGKIYNSIAYMLEASLLSAGFEATHVICEDEETAIQSAIENAMESAADIIITTGGVSVGKKDLLPAVLQEIGADIRFQRAQIQPGTPTIGSVYHGIPILSLSGNPYAAVANFDYYFWPLAAKLTACDAYFPSVEEAILATPYEKVNASRRLLRAYVKQGKVFLPAKSHASSVLSNLMNCNCYLDLPAGTSVKPGDVVTIRRMPF